MLFFNDGSPFAIGAATYLYRPAAERETSPRIILPVLLEDLQTAGFVDTGGVYLLLSPEIAASLGIRPEEGAPLERLWFRTDHLAGVLHRMQLTLRADQGDDLTIEVTAFVPQLSSFQEWPPGFPCVLGMSYCLERLRFAVDPTDDTFYFGKIG